MPAQKQRKGEGTVVPLSPPRAHLSSPSLFHWVRFLKMLPVPNSTTVWKQGFNTCAFKKTSQTPNWNSWLHSWLTVGEGRREWMSRKLESVLVYFPLLWEIPLTKGTEGRKGLFGSEFQRNSVHQLPCFPLLLPGIPHHEVLYTSGQEGATSWIFYKLSSPSDDQVFKRMSLWGTFHIPITTVANICQNAQRAQTTSYDY